MKVPINTHVSLGKYNRETGKYTILLSLPTDTHKELMSQKEKKLKYLLDPETLFIKKQFKDKINNKEVKIDLEYDGKKYDGIVNRYTGSDLRIEDENGEIIFNSGSRGVNTSKVGYLQLYDKEGNKIKNPLA